MIRNVDGKKLSHNQIQKNAFEYWFSHLSFALYFIFPLLAEGTGLAVYFQFQFYTSHSHCLVEGIGFTILSFQQFTFFYCSLKSGRGRLADHTLLFSTL